LACLTDNAVLAPRLAAVEELFDLCANETGDGTSASGGDNEDIPIPGSI